MIQCDTKKAQGCIDILKECVGIKKVDIKTDNRIVYPEWIKKRIKGRIYNLCFRKRFFSSIKPTNVLNYCNLAIKSICPLFAQNVVCLLEKKGKVLHIYFTLSE